MESPAETKEPYRVLARKYRPSNFDELIGQDALVRTLKNAIESGRIAHSFMLTGIRGTGKTTTARIIAKAINYVGPNGDAGPTVGPTDDCTLCQAIAEDRHPDVIEMDAASRTGVDDIRDIIEGVRYAPTEARYKVYIIDEVHMLSKNAFNALLKTLEEPPEHVKFIFATTEIRKVPITVLSRCQRFDLARVSLEDLEAHYANIAKLENTKADDDAIALIARAADGSVRDGLSLLDRAISLSEGHITAERVHDMLGLSDKTQTLSLLSAALSGKADEALNIVSDFYEKGQDPIALIQDLTEMTHILTKVKAAPEARRTVAPNMSTEEFEKTKELAQKLSIPALGKAWQIFLNGTSETVSSSNPQSVLEMVVLRLCYTAVLPDPHDLVKKLKAQNDSGVIGSGGSAAQSASPASGATGHAAHRTSTRALDGGTRATSAATVQATETVATSQTQTESVANANLQSLSDIMNYLEQHGVMVLASELERYVQFISLKDRHLNVALKEGGARELPAKIGKALTDLTGNRWVVSLGKGDAQPTLHEQRLERDRQARAEIEAHPMVKTTLETFPGSKIVEIKNKEETTS